MGERKSHEVARTKSRNELATRHSGFVCDGEQDGDDVEIGEDTVDDYDGSEVEGWIWSSANLAVSLSHVDRVENE